MHALSRIFVVAVVFSLSGFATVATAATPDPTDGSWTLNLANSKFSPGPPVQSQTRTYATTAQGVALSFSGVAADGSKTSGQSNYRYDGKDYPISGSPDFDDRGDAGRRAYGQERTEEGW
jgi:hypothetical protein